MSDTEEAVRGRLMLPDLAPAPPTMTSQLDVEPREEVLERYRTRFAMARQEHNPEP